MKGSYHSTYSDRAALAANQNVAEREFWLKALEGNPEKSCFPTDKHEFQKEGENRKMAAVPFRFSRELYESATKVSSGIDLKLHMILVAGLVVLLEKYTTTGDILIGSPILKQEKEAEFINTMLVYRAQPSAGMTFKDLLIKVKEVIIAAAKNQNFPMEVLPDLLNMDVSGDDFPLFDVALLLENLHDKKYLEKVRFNMLFSFHRHEDRIEGNLEYNSLLYGESFARQVVEHYTHLMGHALANLNITLGGIDILSEQEKHRLLVEFNGKEMSYPKDKTFQQLFEEQAAKTPDRIAVCAHTEDQRLDMTYNELNAKANRLARQLRAEGVGADAIVAVMAERSPAMIVGVMGILKAGGAYLPVDPAYPKERIAFMLEDSKTGLLVCQRHLIDKIDFNGTVIALEDVEKDSSLSDEAGNPEPVNGPGDLAYVIYTSGSTGNPKGVMVQHNHFINVAMAWRGEYRLQEMEVNLLQMASFSFDVFAGDLARVFLNGGKMVINPNAAVAPEELYRLITVHRVTLFESTPSYIVPFMRYVYENDLAIDSLQLLILGSDVCQFRDFRELALRFGSRMRIVNSYGVTEATIDSSYYESPRAEDLPVAGNVPIGNPLPNVKFYILDASGGVLPVGVAGELFIGGDSVARGYWQRPELTAERFLADPFVPGSRVYKTGDLARWLSDGNVEFLGRMDYQVKVRGFRIELGEIENKLLEHDAVKEAVVVERTDMSGDKYLCGYFVSDESLEPVQLREFLGDKLPEYMVPWFYVQMDRLPLTPNGKIDRKALPEPEVEEEIAYAAPRNETERRLVTMWSEVLGVDQESLGIDNRFFDMGGNSLKAIVLMSHIQKTFDVKVQLADIFNLQSIRSLAEYIGESATDRYTAIEKATAKPYYSMSSMQKRFYILQEMDRESTAYNMPLSVVLEGKTDKDRLNDTFRKLIRRHESLRTSFDVIDEEPVQRVHDVVEFAIEYYDLIPGGASSSSGMKVEEIVGNFLRPFDLGAAPLLRVGLIKTEETKHIMLVDIHHIVSDGISHSVLTEDFMRIYSGEELAPLKLHYKDYSEWQSCLFKEKGMEKQEAFWVKQFAGEVPLLNIPCDFPRPELRNFEGRGFFFKIGPEIMEPLKKYMHKQDVSLQILLVSVFHVLLSKLSGQEDIVTGTTIAGRVHPDLELVIGLFANTLALRTYPAGDKMFNDYLKEVRDMSLSAYENQDYPLEELVAKVAADWDKRRNPLFDVMFEIQSGGAADQEANESWASLVKKAGLQIQPYTMQTATTKFDQDWVGTETKDGISFGVKYNTGLFRPESIELMADQFLTLLQNLLEKPGSRIKDLDHHSALEKKLKEVQDLTFNF